MTLPPLTDKNRERQLRAFVFGFTTIKYEMQINHWSYEAVSGSIAAAVRTGWLHKTAIRFGLSGFRATLAAAHEFNAAPSIVRPLGGPQSILPRFMVLTDCGNRQVKPLALKYVPIEQLQADDYRLIPGESHPVTFAYPVMEANPVRIFHRTGEIYRKHQAMPHLANVFQNREFAVRILAPSIGKARAIADVFVRRNSAVPVEIEVIEEAQAWVG